MLSVKEDVIRISYDWSRTNDCKNQQISSCSYLRKTRRTAPPQTFGRTFPPLRPRGWYTFRRSTCRSVGTILRRTSSHDHTRAPHTEVLMSSRASFPISSVVPSPVCPRKRGSLLFKLLRKLSRRSPLM